MASRIWVRIQIALNKNVPEQLSALTEHVILTMAISQRHTFYAGVIDQSVYWLVYECFPKWNNMTTPLVHLNTTLKILITRNNATMAQWYFSQIKILIVSSLRAKIQFKWYANVCHKHRCPANYWFVLFYGQRKQSPYHINQVGNDIPARTDK